MFTSPFYYKALDENLCQYVVYGYDKSNPDKIYVDYSKGILFAICGDLHAQFALTWCILEICIPNPTTTLNLQYRVYWTTWQPWRTLYTT